MSAKSKNATVAPTFGSSGWELTEAGFSKDTLAVAETLFAQANGYVGTRGTFEDPVADGIQSTEGTYLNGVYLRDPIHYDESAFGFATHNNKMVLVPDAKRVELTADGEQLVQGESNIDGQTRTLDMATGLLSRISHWRLKTGGTLTVQTRRFVSMATPGLMALEYCLTATDFNGKIALKTGLDAAYGTHNDEFDPRSGTLSIDACLADGQTLRESGTISTTHHVRGSDHAVIAACRLTIEGPTHSQKPADDTRYAGADITLSLKPGDTVRLVKYVGYADGPATDRQKLLSALDTMLQRSESIGFDALFQEHCVHFKAFWESANISVSSDDPVQESLRFGMFHLFQSAGRDGNRSLAAKGLSGPGYDGHYFWDTEIYAVPFFTFTQPAIARSLLKFRISTLDGARTRARTMGHEKGALFPWRTIGGEECSSFFPAGTAQYHINAAIAYALTQYVDATGDAAIMDEGGTELLLETARIWMDLGHFSKARDGKFCIGEVTGPDEYTAMVDNNLYTNMMARHHLRAAAIAARTAPRSLSDKIGLSATEIAAWEQAAKQMYVPYDEQLGIHEQCDGFFDKPEWDFAATPAENYPLLLHYHPLVIYRHQVLKQPDVVMAQILLPHDFSAGEKCRNLAYYEPRTTHDSTLSACIHAIAHAESGNMEKAYAFFEETYRMDLENRHNNTHYGVHIACMAGSWMGLTYGFGGMRMAGGALSFTPKLPDGWENYEFRIQFQGAEIWVRVEATGASYTHVGGPAIRFQHLGNHVTLAEKDTITLPIGA